MAPATVSAGWLWEMRSAIVARVCDRNPIEVADDLGHRFGDDFRMADHPGAILPCPESRYRVGSPPRILVTRRLGSGTIEQSRRSLTAAHPALKMERLKNHTPAE